MEKEGFFRIVFPNGLTLLIQNKEYGTVSFGIGVRFGAAHHLASHLLEHMLFKGTKTRTALDIRREAVCKGGSHDAFVGFFSTLYITKNLTAYGYEALDLLCDMIANSTFPKEEMERERKVVLLEHKTRSKEPEAVLMDKIYRTLYCNTPLERAVIDDEEVLNKITREELITLYRKWYEPSKLIIVGVGPIDINRVKEIVKNYFPQTEKDAVVPTIISLETPAPISGKIIVAEGEKNQVHLMAGFQAVPRTHPDFYPLRVFSMIIGESVSSRLFEAARERTGLVYNISSHFDTVQSSWQSTLKADCTFYHGALRIYSIFSIKNIGHVERIIKNELSKLTKQLISEEDLSRNKEQLIGCHLLAMQGTYQYMRMLFAAEANDSVDEFYKFEEQILAVTAKDVQRIAQKYCRPSHGVWVILKPKSNNGIHK